MEDLNREKSRLMACAKLDIWEARRDDGVEMNKPLSGIEVRHAGYVMQPIISAGLLTLESVCSEIETYLVGEVK